MVNWRLITIISVSAALVALAGWIWWAFFDTYHLATVQDGVLYRDGIRSLHEFSLSLRKAHVKTVVSLVDDQEIVHSPFTDEVAYCKSHGIDLVRFPIDLGGWPSGEQIREFLSIVQDRSRQPVIVHCAQGVRRTGMMVAAYQISVLNFDKSRALSSLMTFGHSQRTVGDIQRFIETYDPVAREMTTQLPASRE